jgi:hypothetical protein
MFEDIAGMLVAFGLIHPRALHDFALHSIYQSSDRTYLFDFAWRRT